MRRIHGAATPVAAAVTVLVAGIAAAGPADLGSAAANAGLAREPARFEGVLEPDPDSGCLVLPDTLPDPLATPDPEPPDWRMPPEAHDLRAWRGPWPVCALAPRLVAE